MAIDTAAKRLSALDFEEVFAEAIPIPDGTVSQADRQHLIWSYSGISMAIVILSIPGCVTGTDTILQVVTLADALFGTITMADAESVGSVTVGDEACNIALPMELPDLSGYWKLGDDSDLEWT